MVAYGDLGRAWLGGRAGRTCPIFPPLPDLDLVLPFSSPCSLQAPSFLLLLPTPTVGSWFSEPLLHGTRKGTSRELRTAQLS